MGLNAKCPKCGGTDVTITNMKSKHGILYTILFGVFYWTWLCIKYFYGMMVFICWDWWMMIVKKNQGKGYTPISKKWMSFSKKVYHCNKCGYNFHG